MSSRKEFITDKLANAELNDYDRSMFQVELQQIEEQERERKESIEAKVQEEMPLTIPGTDLTSLPGELITLIDKIRRADRRQLLNEHAIELEQLEHDNATINGYLQEASEKAELYRLKLEKMEEDHNIYVVNSQTIIFELNRLVSDTESKRDAAANQLSEALDEVGRLKSELEDYQKAKAFGEREAQQIIDVTAEESDEINEALEAVKKLYTASEDWGSVIKLYREDGTFTVVPRDEAESNWAQANVPIMDGSQFRNEAESSGDQLSDGDTEAASNIPNAPLNHFRDEETAQCVDGEPVPVRTVAEQGTGTVEERIARLEEAVFGQVKAVA